jgi:uncharacterized membrane protein YgaE (UPF0421/DUF939 family)
MAKKDTDNTKPTDREKKYQKKVAQERKKLERIISFPSKALFYISLIVSLMAFIYSYFSNSQELISAILTSFFGFAATFIGVGIALILFFYFKSEQIKKEYEERILREQYEKENQESARYKSELSELENIEKELSQNKAKSTTAKTSSKSETKKSSRNVSDEEAYLEEILNSNFKP